MSFLSFEAELLNVLTTARSTPGERGKYIENMGTAIWRTDAGFRECEGEGYINPPVSGREEEIQCKHI